MTTPTKKAAKAPTRPRATAASPTTSDPAATGAPEDTPAGSDSTAKRYAPKVGHLVDFETTDPVTSHPLSGVGLVVEVDDDGQLLVAPLTVQGIRLSADDVTAR